MTKNKVWYGGKCKVCKGINEPYMVTHELWKKVVGGLQAGLVCISCFEEKLERRLELSDFLVAPINNGVFGFVAKKYVKYGRKYLIFCKKIYSRER